MIWPADKRDIADLVEMGRRCALESHWNIPPVDADIADSFRHVMSGPGFVLRSPNGFISVVIVPVYFNREARQAMELNWYSADGRDGVRLLKAAANEARKRGAKVFSIGTQATTEKVARVYARLGFKPFGATFQMEL